MDREVLGTDLYAYRWRHRIHRFMPETITTGLPTDTVSGHGIRVYMNG